MRAIFAALVACALGACGSDEPVLDAGVDLSSGTGDLSAPAADLDVPIACSTDGDCPSNDQRCAWVIAEGCAAKLGTCRPRLGPPFCNARRVLCGCDGVTKNGDGDCFFERGYASGPTTGERATGGCGADGGN